MSQVFPVVDGGVEDGGDVDETGNISVVGILNVSLNLKYSLESPLDSIEGQLQLSFNSAIYRNVSSIGQLRVLLLHAAFTKNLPHNRSSVRCVNLLS